MQSIKVEKLSGYSYWTLLPDGYGKEQGSWPAILFLHGAGERGNDLDLIKKYGPPRIAEESRNFPLIVIAPQCPRNKVWANDQLTALLDEAIDQYEIDRDRIYLTGISMGGAGVWKLASAHPDRFAAIAPICGYSYDPSQVLSLTKTPVWVFHGAKDDVVPVVESERIVNMLRQNGGTVKFTVYPDAGHAEAWEIAYSDWNLYDWFLQHTRRFLE